MTHTSVTHTYSKSQLIDQLRQIQQDISATVQAMPLDHFNREGADGTWSASGYLKHLILSVKPLAKGLKLGSEGVMRLSGTPDHPSRTYPDLVAVYQAGIAAGVRAELSPSVVPVNYRLPEGIEAGSAAEQTYLIETWNEANDRLIAALEGWEDAQFDTHQLPHPAIGLLTVREILYFTVHHNTLHGNDIRQTQNT
ncbi:MAG: DinB family protein [Anaerolineae bacterium]